MTSTENRSTPEALRVPDRFEGLRDIGSGTLKGIVVAVPAALEELDDRFADMHAAHRGGLALLRGETGAGKSTFLDTVHLFRKDVTTIRVPADADVATYLASLTTSEGPRIAVMEGREALGEVSEAALEAAMHTINAFVRSEAGRQTLVVWPTNTDELTERLRSLGERIGGDALLGIGDPVTRFLGPPKGSFVEIAERTVAALNEGASLAALGISESEASSLAQEAQTIGRYLAVIRHTLIRNGRRVRNLMKVEEYRLWTIVIAGNDPEGDVAALTRGGAAYADIDRLMTATGANIVQDLKQEPDTLGILGTVLDAKIIHMDMVTALAIARRYGDEELHNLMRSRKMNISRDKSAQSRLLASELGVIMSGQSLGTRKRGGKPGDNTVSAFNNLAHIARRSDGALNRAIAAALLDSGLVSHAETERDLGTTLKFFSDIYVTRQESPIRIEVMWRQTTSRAEIANYVLGKLGNYARAIGLIGKPPA